MKKIFLSLAFSIILFGFNNNSVSAQKIAFINSDSLIISMPDTDSANKKLEAFVTPLSNQSRLLEDEYHKMVSDYENNSNKWAPSIKELKGNDIAQMEQKIKNFQEKAQADVSEKRQDLFAPIIAKAKNAIATVAKEKGYAYVLDESQGAILYASQSDNIMSDVKKKLGIK